MGEQQTLRNDTGRQQSEPRCRLACGLPAHPHHDAIAGAEIHELNISRRAERPPVGIPEAFLEVNLDH